MKYISELVSDQTPIVSTCRACECKVGGTPPISSIPLSALGVLDGDGLCSSSVKESLYALTVLDGDGLCSSFVKESL